MLTDNQIAELEILLKEKKEKNQSLRIAEVTKVIYPLENNPIKPNLNTLK